MCRRYAGAGAAAQGGRAAGQGQGGSLGKLLLTEFVRGGCSCAGDTLEQAQLRKMDALLAKARVAAGDHVLEVGCGWGSLALRAVQVPARWTLWCRVQLPCAGRPRAGGRLRLGLPGAARRAGARSLDPMV